MRKLRPSFWLVCLLTALSALVAVLQYRWLGELRRLEADQLSRAIQRQATVVARSFERELRSPLMAFNQPGDPGLQRQLHTWRQNQESQNAFDLVADLYRYDLLEDVLYRIEPRVSDRTNPSEPASWPAELAPLHARLLTIGGAVRNRRIRDARGLVAALGGSNFLPAGPALVRPLSRAGDQRQVDRRRMASRFAQSSRASVLIVHLDLSAMHALLADLVATRLEEDLGFPVDAALFDSEGQLLGTILDNQWRDATIGATKASELFSRREFREAVKVPLGASFVSDARPAGPPAARASDARRGPWILAVRPRGESVRAAATRQRVGSLLLGGALTLLLAGTGILLYRHARRTEDFAARQRDFVAAISHELHTPLAAISSAGANLADGVIREPDRVREYGRLLQKEGRRLGHIVSQALALAGVESQANPRRGSCTLEDALNGAIESTRLLAQDAEGHVEFDAERIAAVPRLAMPADDAQRVFDNLLSNAFKYGAQQVRILVDGAESISGSATTVRIVVEDDGPGIARQDRKRIFEPFRRGRAQVESTAPGSGLGLYLVRTTLERHSGKIQLVTADKNVGARFHLEIPLQEKDDSEPTRRRLEASDGA